MGDFSNDEKIIYSLKYALNLTTKDPTAAPGFEFLSAPRIFPSSIPTKDLLKVGEGDIDSEGKNSNGGLVDLTAPYDTVKLYKIIDPITNKVSNKNINDILGTSFTSIKQVYNGASKTNPTASTFSTGTVYRYWFHDYNTLPYDGTKEPAFNWKGLRLAYAKSTPGDEVLEDNDNYVPHIGLYLGVPLTPISGSSWDNGTGDSISYEHEKAKGRYLLGLLGLSNTFKTRILKNDYNTIKVDTASANEGDTWFTNPTYGLLSFYGIKDTKALGTSGIGVAPSECPRLSFCRYIGESVDFSNIGSGGGGASVTVGVSGEDAPTDSVSKGDLFFDIDDNTLKINKDGTDNGWVGVGGGGSTQEKLHVNGNMTVSGLAFASEFRKLDGTSISPVTQIKNWTETKKLTVSDGAQNDEFGISVAISSSVPISSSYAIVGDHQDDDNKGAVYIFERASNGNWSQKIKLTAADGVGDDYLGSSVAISGNYAIAGARGDSSKKGAAYIFERASNGNWSQKIKLTAADGDINEYFGVSVAISGNYAIIGARGGYSSKGAVYIFEDSNGNWSQKTKLLASDGDIDDYFGSSVAISGNYAIVGAWLEDDKASDAGSAYIFERDSNGNWSQKTKLLASDGDIDDYFGSSVAISGNYAIVGAYNNDTKGSVYIFESDSNGNWNQKTKLLASDGASDDMFGYSVAISGNYAIVGALLEDDNASNAGAAYIFERDSNGNWNQKTKLLASDGASDDYLGHSVAISGNNTIVGATFKNTAGIAAGAAYIFEEKTANILLNNDTWTNGSYTKIIGDNTSARKAIWWNYDNSPSGTQIRDNDSIGFYTDGVTGTDHTLRMIIKENGNVGIGTSSPYAPLHISYANGNYANGSQGFINEATSGRSTTRLRSTTNNACELFFDVNGAARWDFSCRNSSNNYDLMIFKQGSIPSLGSVSSPIMTLAQSGNVGIGTDSPDKILHLHNSSRVDIKFDTGDEDHYIRKDGNYLRFRGHNDSTILFELRNNNDGGNSCNFPSGKVGIGTPTPSEELHIIGNIMLSNNNSTSNYRNEGIRIVPYNSSSEQNGGGHIKFREDYDDQHGISIGYNGGADNSILNWKANTFNISRHDNNVTGSPVITIQRWTGNVGIRTNSPTHPLHVHGYVQRSENFQSTEGSTAATYYAGYAGSNQSYNWKGDGSTYNNSMTIKASTGILAMTGFWTKSDGRVKKNITEINDYSSLQKVRDISCVSYNYKDVISRGSSLQVGFIAQQVLKHFPQAITYDTDFIPDKLEKITDASWNKTKLFSESLVDVSGVKYRFYVHDISDNIVETELDIVGNPDNSFTFEKKWDCVFCFGKEVEDLHILDKPKLFALNFSATQEIDRIQQKQLLDISGNTIAVEANKVEIELLKLENQELTNKVTSLETELNNLKTIVESLVNNN